jgi:hypothetical protein
MLALRGEASVLAACALEVGDAKLDPPGGRTRRPESWCIDCQNNSMGGLNSTWADKSASEKWPEALQWLTVLPHLAA